MVTGNSRWYVQGTNQPLAHEARAEGKGELVTTWITRRRRLCLFPWDPKATWEKMVKPIVRLDTGKLRTLPFLHRRPINLVVYQGTDWDDSSWRGLRA